ncbi:MAG: DUF421 domain-containing protein [Bacilli bacterium]
MLSGDEILCTITTNIIIFFTLLVVARLMGKKQLSQLTFFNYITGITIGSIAANAVNIDNSTNYDDYIGVIIWFVFTIIISIITLKSSRLRTIFDGEPAIVIKKGKIQDKILKSLRLNLNDLTMLLREKNVFNISDVDYAILETNGKISILKKEGYNLVTKEDMNIKTNTKPFINTSVIIDGNLIKNNLKELNIKEVWLKQELKKQNIKDYKDVLYAEVKNNGTLYVDKEE